MKKIICIIMILLLAGIPIFLVNINNKELVNLEDIKTDRNLKNVTYDKKNDVWEDSVLGILSIEKIGLSATVKEGTTDEILSNYIGHIEETAIYDGNIGLAAHNRGYENSYFARLNELEIGDTVKYKTKFYERTYIVDNIQVIYETDWSLLQTTKENRLTMITCISNHKEQRLCVQATEVIYNSTEIEVQ